MIFKRLLLGIGLLSATGLPSAAQDISPGGGTIGGPLCVGFTCADFEQQLGQLRVRDTNIKLELIDDTNEGMPGFPSGDWQITTGVLGESFEIGSITFGRFPLVIKQGINDFAITVAENGDIGLGERNPEKELHIVSLDTPTIRLDQPTFEPQVWDIGANESNFFIRDTNTDTLPFRIRPSAPSNALYVAANGEIGMGIPDPEAALHIRRNQPNNVPHLILQNRRADGRAEIWFEDENTSTDNDALRLQLNDDTFNISFNGTGGAELVINKSGNVAVPRGNLSVLNGSIRVGGQALNVPDYVFAPDYELMPLDAVGAFIAENSHLPHIPSAAEIQDQGLDMVEMQLKMLKTIEEMALHTLALHARIEVLEAANASFAAQLSARSSSPD